MRTENKTSSFNSVILKFNKTFSYTYITSKTFFTKQAIGRGYHRLFRSLLSREFSSAKFVANFFQLVKYILWKLSAKPQSSEAVESL